MKNVLLIAGGRRVDLGRRFEQAGYTPIFYELCSTAPVSTYFRTVKGLKWDDKKIYWDIEDTIKRFNPSFVFPLQDAAIPILARIKQRGYDNIIVSDEKTANICTDKQSFETFMLSNFPFIYPYPEVHKKMIVKPRFGYGSRGITIEESPELIVQHNKVCQRFVEGVEYSVDAYFDKKNSYVDSVPRIRNIIGRGEVVSSTTKENKLLQYYVKEVGRKLQLYGPINFQFIVGKGAPALIEINARFGGGMTLSMEAGLDIIKLLEIDRGLSKECYSVDKWRKGLTVERSYQDHFFTEPCTLMG